MGDREVFDSLTSLEHAVAQPDDRLLRDGEVGVNARLRAGVLGQHEVFILIRAAFGRLGGRVLGTPDAAGNAQRVHIRLPIEHLLFGAVRVQVDVVQIVAARKHVLTQRGRGRAVHDDVLQQQIPLERAIAYGFKRRRQVEGAAQRAAAFKRACADGGKPIGQRHRTLDPGEIEREIADSLSARKLKQASLIGVVEGVVADGLERRGKLYMAKRRAVVKRAIADGLKPLGQLQQRQIVVVRKRLRTDGLHCCAADGLRDSQIGGVAVVAGDGAGGSVKIELRFHIAVVVHDNGAFAAGLDGHRAAGACKRLRVGIQLIVRNIGHRVLGKNGKAILVNHRAYALEGDFAQRFAECERAVADIAHTCGDGDFSKRAAVAKVQAVDDHQALGKGYAHQVGTPGDGVAPELEHRLGQRKCGNGFPGEDVDVDHVHRAAIDLAGHGHIAARTAVAAEHAVFRVIIPLGGFGQSGDAYCQHQQGENQAEPSLHE